MCWFEVITGPSCGNIERTRVTSVLSGTCCTRASLYHTILSGIRTRAIYVSKQSNQVRNKFVPKIRVTHDHKLLSLLHVIRPHDTCGT